MVTASIRRRHWVPSAVLVFVASLMAANAVAHARWLPDGTTPGRNNQANIKSGPCGASRSNDPAVFKAGETITLQWESTIHHKGYFRIAFSPAGDAGFDQHVLLDNIVELENRFIGEYSAQVTLPSEPCNDCTLQIIQVMLDRDPPTNYYSCADIQLVADTTSDMAPPQVVSNLEEERGLPDLRLRWQNPKEDFAGVLVLRGESEPQVGVGYLPGDVIGNAVVVYVGAAQAADVPAANAGDTLNVYAFDMAHNYSTRVEHEVLPAPPVMPPVVTLGYEQLGQPSLGIYAADGKVLFQASVDKSAANGNITVQWSVGSATVLPLEVLGGYQATLNPVSYAGQNLLISVTVTDSATPPNVVQESFESKVKPLSYYSLSFVLMQQGKEVSQVNANNGIAEIRVVFEGETPSDGNHWYTTWQHDIPNATQAPLSLTFMPVSSAIYKVSAQVFTPTAQAGDEEVMAVVVNKPVKLGVFGGLAGGGLSLLFLVRLWIRRRVRLQGAA